MQVKSNQDVYVVITAIAILLCLGIAYIWGVSQAGFANSVFGGNHASVGLTFSLLLSMLLAGGVIGGKFSARYSAQFVIILWGIIISAGFFLSSLATPQTAWLLWMDYGIIGGIGMGFIYSTTIALAQKWFPNKKGLVTGILVAALGLGGVIFTPIIERLITHFGGSGVGELKTFMVLSLIFFVVCTLDGMFMKDLPPTPVGTGAVQRTKRNYRSSEIPKSMKFYLIMATFMLAYLKGHTLKKGSKA